MSSTEKTFGVLKSLLLYQETVKALREDLTALATDVTSLGRAHASLAERVSRIEGFIEGASARSGQPRLPRK